MPYTVTIADAAALFPEYTFVSALTPSEQKAAFHVRDADDNNLCLKIIAPNSSVDRVEREIRALQDVAHPNVVSLKEYTFSSKPGSSRHYMVEEFIEGADLSTKLQPGNAWDLDYAAQFFSRLLGGLNALSVQNIVHRDLKPSNIRVKLNDDPVIVDFGVCRHLDLPDLTQTAQGAAIGTPAYFAPEQFLGTKREVDHRTDIFAIGVLLYQAVVGEHPFWNPTMFFPEIKDAVCNSDDYLTVAEFTQLPPNWVILFLVS